MSAQIQVKPIEILLVEDSPSDADLAREALSQQNFYWFNLDLSAHNWRILVII